MKIKPILGYNCYRAYQVYRDIILASYIFWSANKIYLSDDENKPESYKDFLLRFERSTEEERREIDIEFSILPYFRSVSDIAASERDQYKSTI